ncbi:MAG: ABC transporter permease [Actinomycetota bacterium]
MSESSSRIASVVRKEFREYRRNRFILGTTLVLPLVFLGIPITNMLTVARHAAPAAVRALAESAMLMMLLVPVIIPVTIAAYAVIGERDQGTLEPMLTTPIAEKELIFGKAIASIVPSVILAYLIGIVFAIVIRLIGNKTMISVVWASPRIVAQVLFAPLLATWSTWVGMSVSARSSDVRVAQQLSSLGSLPVLGLTSLFTFRVLSPTIKTALVMAAALAIIDSFGWRMVSAMFDRERLLSQYGK